MLDRRGLISFCVAGAIAAAIGTARFHPVAAEEVWQTLPAPAALPTAVESGSAKVNGIDLYYATYGSGDPVILLHGGLGNVEYWGNQVPALAKDHRVILVDSRGHGRSTRDNQTYTYGLMASDVLALMDQLKIEKAAIVGWSDGGIIGLDLAMHHPERLTRVFAFGANYNPSGVRPDVMENPTFSRYIEQTGKDYERLSATPKDFEGFVNAISTMWATEPNYPAAALKAITVPVTIADGEHDEAIKREHTEEMAKLIPGAKLLILPGVSHFAMLQNPDQFNAALEDFLAGK